MKQIDIFPLSCCHARYSMTSLAVAMFMSLMTFGSIAQAAPHDLKKLLQSYKSEKNLSSRSEVGDFYITAIRDAITGCQGCDDALRFDALEAVATLATTRSKYGQAIDAYSEQMALDVSPYTKFESAYKLANVASWSTSLKPKEDRRSNQVLGFIALADAAYMNILESAKKSPYDIRIVEGEKVAIRRDMPWYTSLYIKLGRLKGEWLGADGNYAQALETDLQLIELMKANGEVLKNTDFQRIYNRSIQDAIKVGPSVNTVSLIKEIIRSGGIASFDRIPLVELMTNNAIEEGGVSMAGGLLKGVSDKSFGAAILRDIANELHSRKQYKECVQFLEAAIAALGESPKALALKSDDPLLKEKMDLYALLAATYTDTKRSVEAKAINGTLQNLRNTNAQKEK